MEQTDYKKFARKANIFVSGSIGTSFLLWLITGFAGGWLMYGGWLIVSLICVGIYVLSQE